MTTLLERARKSIAHTEWEGGDRCAVLRRHDGTVARLVLDGAAIEVSVCRSGRWCAPMQCFSVADVDVALATRRIAA